MILIAMQKIKYPNYWMVGGEENIQKTALLSSLLYTLLEFGFQAFAKPLFYFHLNKKKPDKNVRRSRVFRRPEC